MGVFGGLKNEGSAERLAAMVKSDLIAGPSEEIQRMRAIIEEQSSIIRALQDSRTMLQQVVRNLVNDALND